MENINRVHQLSALRESAPALGARAFPEDISSSRAERSPRGGAEASGTGLWGQASSCTRQAATKELSGRPRWVVELLPRGQGGLTRSLVCALAVPGDVRWAAPAVHWVLGALISALSNALAGGVQLSHSPDPGAGLYR